jgi:hypothetical protein
MKTIALSILSVLALSAHAAPIAQVGRPDYAGNGCPAGSAQFSVSSDGQNYILRPTQLVAHTGADNGKRVDRKSCMLVIPVKVAAGYSVGLVSRISGFVAADRQSKVQVDQELFFAGSSGTKLSNPYTNTRQNIMLYSTSSPAKISWSACGASTNARLNLAILAQGAESTAALQDIRFRLVTKKCQ